MITLCIRYTLDAAKLADFETYARGVVGPAERCGGRIAGYYLPTKFAGATNFAMALIDFPNLAAYEQYRAKLGADPEHTEIAQRCARSGCILIEDRSFLQRAG